MDERERDRDPWRDYHDKPIRTTDELKAEIQRDSLLGPEDLEMFGVGPYDLVEDIKNFKASQHSDHILISQPQISRPVPLVMDVLKARRDVGVAYKDHIRSIVDASTIYERDRWHHYHDEAITAVVAMCRANPPNLLLAWIGLVVGLGAVVYFTGLFDVAKVYFGG